LIIIILIFSSGTT